MTQADIDAAIQVWNGDKKSKQRTERYMYELLNPPSYLRNNIQVNYAEFTAEWNITSKNSVGYNNVAAYVTYGTDRANAYRILEDSLNLRDTRIYDTVTDPDGKERRVLNSKETTLAQQKQQAVKDAFHETGRVYDADLEDIVQNQERLWQAATDILVVLAKLK